MKRILSVLTLLTFLACTNLPAQTTIISQRTVGGNNGDYLHALALTKDEGFIAGGESDSNKSGEKSEDSRGLEDYWVVKFKKNLKIEWQRTLGGAGGEGLAAIQQTTDGGYILGGTSESNISGEKTQNSRGGFDCWIIKLDSLGNIQWDKTIGGSGNDGLAAIQHTTDGGYILGAYSVSDISGEKTSNSRGSEDYWIIKLDAAGNIQWDKTIGGFQQDHLTSVQQTKDGGYISGGFSWSAVSGEKTENNNGGFWDDYWVVKLDGAGNIQWDKTIGGGGSDELYALQQTRDSGYMLGGVSASGAGFDKTENSKGGTDYWIVKLNKNGKVKWDKTIGGTGLDELKSTEQTTDGGYILGGFSQSDASGDKTENRMGYNDYWVVKVNRNGAIQWENTIGGNEGDELFVAREIKNSVYILGGNSNSNISGDKTQNSRGNFDFWLLALRYQPSTAVNNISNATITNYINKIYPNPTKDILHIQNTGTATFTLTNQSGKILITKTINTNGAINISHLPAGLYYLKNNETGAVQKVIVAK